MSLPAGSEAPGALPSFQRILLATDFSAQSAAAAPFAALLADYYDSEIFATYIIPAESKPARGMESEPEQSEESAQAQMQRFLAEHLHTDAPRHTIIARGVVWDALADVIQKQGIDLVVLGTHGRRGLGKLMLGSVAEHIFQMAPCPVLSIGPRVRKSWGSEGKLRKILYATDLAGDSLHALPHALSLSQVSGAELMLLHVPEAATGQEHLPGLHDRLNSLVPAEARKWCRCDTLVIAGEPGDVILRTARQQDVDFIVMGGHRVEGPLYAVKVPATTAYRVVSRADRAVLRVRS
jgi:nucleotide-binding universal stress UspA family protein